MGRGVPYEVWGSVVSSPSGIRGRAPAGNAFWPIWRILKAAEHSFLNLYTEIFGGKAEVWGGGNCPLCRNVERRLDKDLGEILME